MWILNGFAHMYHLHQTAPAVIFSNMLITTVLSVYLETIAAGKPAIANQQLNNNS